MKNKKKYDFPIFVREIRGWGSLEILQFPFRTPLKL